MEILNESKNEKKEDCNDNARRISQLIRNRRSIYANQFIKKELPNNLLEEILLNATWAPTHKMTEPWRFIILKGKYLADYGEYMVKYYQELYTKELSTEALENRLDFLRKYPLNASCLIGVILVKNKKIELPEWEEIAAISAAVQNIALSCNANNIGSYWSTKSVAIDYIADFGLAENEKSLGLLYLGYYPDDLKLSSKKRTPLTKKVIYLE